MARFALIHGAGDVGWYWHLLEAELLERGHDVVAPDLPSEDDAAGLAEHADAVVDAIGDRLANRLEAYLAEPAEPGMRMAGRAPERYDRFVALIMAPFVQALLDAAQVGPGDTVLDVACGTGFTARAAAARVGPTGQVVGTDGGALTGARPDGVELATGSTVERLAARTAPDGSVAAPVRLAAGYRPPLTGTS